MSCKAAPFGKPGIALLPNVGEGKVASVAAHVKLSAKPRVEDAYCDISGNTKAITTGSIGPHRPNYRYPITGNQPNAIPKIYSMARYSHLKIDRMGRYRHLELCTMATFSQPWLYMGIYAYI